jgi:uncharacterized protein YceH (UPF0502 family)
MGVLKPLKKMVSARLAEDEYERLVELSSIQGAHSTSDMARTAICAFLEHNGNHSGQRRASGAELQAKVEHLEAEVRRLSRRLSSKAAEAGR